MLVVVTGGAGFIGSHVVDKLRDQGVRVRVFDMVSPNGRDDIEFYQGSLLNPEDVLMGFQKVDAVFHLAAIADVGDVLNDPVRSEAINVRGTLNVLEAARKAGVNRVIYGSTIWVYNDTNAAEVDEETPLLPPAHMYTATKLASEYYCHAYSKLYNLDATILRYGIPYGPRARGAAVIPSFVKKALSGEPIEIQGDGSQTRRFIYVEDLAEGNVLALKPRAANRTYNLEGKESFTILELANIIQRLVGEVEIRHTEGRPGDFTGKIVSRKRAKEELGWEPHVGLEEGIARYIKWLKKTEQIKSKEWEAVSASLQD